MRARPFEQQPNLAHIGQEANRGCLGCRTMGSQLAMPVALLHAFAFALGYFLCKILGFNEKTARTVSIETGMPAAHLSIIRLSARVK